MPPNVTRDADHPPAIAVRDVVRRYADVQALAGVSLDVRPGEAIGLVGHNGAGKSTLTRILGGLEAADAGTIEVRGRRVDYGSPDAAIAAGVALVPQRLSIVPLLTVEENVLLGLGRRARHRSLGTRLRDVATQLGIADQLERKARDVRPSTQRLVMIARALMREPSVLLLDEPTAALHPDEARRLFAIVERLRTDGLAIVFISHRLEEVLAETSRVVVLRQGRVVASASCESLSARSLGALITGRELDDERQPEARATPLRDDPLLVCDDVAIGDRVRGVDLRVHAGEVVGVAGLNGSGRSELLRAIAGLERLRGGQMRVGDAPVGPSRRESQRAGIAFLPDDRGRNAIVPEMTVAATVTLANDRPSRIRPWLPVLRQAAERRRVDAALADLDIHPARPAGRKMKHLSGGNQQKALMVRAMLSGARVYLFDEPTEGVDVGAREDLHRQIRRLAADGAAVVVASSESDELVRVADRIVVLFDGAVAAELTGPAIDEHVVTHACLIGDTR